MKRAILGTRTPDLLLKNRFFLLADYQLVIFLFFFVFTLFCFVFVSFFTIYLLIFQDV